VRPNSIVQFDRFYLGAIVVGLINNLLTWNQTQAMLADPNVNPAGLGTGFQIGSMVVGLAISLLLWWLVSRKASNIAKWIIVVLFGLGLIGVLMSIGTMMQLGMLSAVVALVGVALQGFAVFMLFKPDAVAWLTNKGPTNPDVFN
jgi:hypothetical protein